MLAWLKNKQFVRFGAVGLTVFLFAFVANPANAAGGISADIATALANIILLVANAVGAILMILIEVAMIPLIQYSKFIDHTVVTNGWSIVRDLMNTGFIILMLIIAFGTMFGISRIQWQQHIPRLIVAAIAINFSRLITGLFIDFGQVIMIGFVNAIQQVGAGNFLELLKLRDFQTFTNKEFSVSGSELFGTAILGLVMTVIAFIVVLMIVALLTYRIVVLWVLIVLSPAAFLAGATQGILSQASNMYSQWWGKLTAAIMIGPILTFFLWLALSSVSVGSGITKDFNTNNNTTVDSPIVSEIGVNDKLTGFIIGIALLLAGIEMATSTAGQMGSAAGAIAGSLGGVAKMAATAPIALGVAGAAAAGKKGVKSFRSVGGAAVLSTRSKWRGIREDKRVGAIDAGIAKANANIASGGFVRGILGRRRLAVHQKDRDKELANKKALAEKFSGAGAGMSTDQSVALIENNSGPRASENQKAIATQVKSRIVGDETAFADYHRKDPAAASSMLADVKEHYAQVGDEKGQESVKEMLKRNPQWEYTTAEAASKMFKGMGPNEARKVPAGAYESAHMREGMIESGVFADTQINVPTLDPTLTGDAKKDRQIEIRETKQKRDRARSGMSEKQLSAIDNAYDVRNDDKHEKTRHQAASDELRGKDMSDPVNKEAAISNEAINKLINALNGGSLEALVKSGIRLQDVSFSDHKGDPETRQAILNAMRKIASNDYGVAVVQSLQDAVRRTSTPEEIRESGRANMSLMDMRNQARLGGADKSTQAALDGNASSFGLDSSGEKFVGATPADSARMEREFADALAKNPNLILSLQGDIAKGGDNSAITRVAAESVSKASLRKMWETMQLTKGSPQEYSSRHTMLLFGQLLKKYTATVQRLASASATQKKGISDMARFFERRYSEQVGK